MPHDNMEDLYNVTAVDMPHDSIEDNVTTLDMPHDNM